MPEEEHAKRSVEFNRYALPEKLKEELNLVAVPKHYLDKDSLCRMPDHIIDPDAINPVSLQLTVSLLLTFIYGLRPGSIIPSEHRKEKVDHFMPLRNIEVVSTKTNCSR